MIQIKVKDLSFSYSGFRALQDISFEAGAGDMLAIIGQNGSANLSYTGFLANLPLNMAAISSPVYSTF